jgi:hypothetical protein
VEGLGEGPRLLDMDDEGRTKGECLKQSFTNDR